MSSLLLPCLKAPKSKEKKSTLYTHTLISRFLCLQPKILKSIMFEVNVILGVIMLKNFCTNNSSVAICYICVCTPYISDTLLISFSSVNEFLCMFEYAERSPQQICMDAEKWRHRTRTLSFPPSVFTQTSLPLFCTTLTSPCSTPT